MKYGEILFPQKGNMFKSVQIIILLTLSLVFTACVGDSTKGSGGTTGGTPTQVNRVTGTSFTEADFNNNVLMSITLQYTDLDGFKASSCTISNLSKVTVQTACSCNASGVCTVGVKGNGTTTGAGGFSFNVVSNGRTSTTGRVSFNLLASLPNTAPVSSNTTSTFNEDVQSIITLPYTDVDSDPAHACTISNLSNVTVTQACACSSGTCTVGVTGTSNYNGAGSFDFTVTANNQVSNTSSATLTISAVNDTPTISSLANQTIAEGGNTGALAFTITDVDSTVDCSNVTGVSSNTTLIPNANVVIGGTAPNCTVTATATGGQSGTSTITLTHTDTGTPMPAQTATTSFTVTVSGTNTAPTISSIANQTTNEDVAMPAKSFTIGDTDSTVTCSDVTATSSDTTLLPVASIVISGTGTSCNVSATPALNQNGSVNITLTVTDHGSPLPALTASTTFSLTVSAVNDAPTISVIADQNTSENTPTSAVNFSILDVDSTIACTNVAGTSNNTTLVPNANIVIGGTAPTCTVTVTPAANENGTAEITLTLTDTGTPAPNLSATSVFNVVVGPSNNPPTISFIANASTNEDTAVDIDFTIDDADSSPAMACSSSNLAIFSSSNGTLIPGIPGSDVVFSGTYPNCRATFTPASNQNGSSNIVIRVTDNGMPMPALTVDSNVFTITVDPINDAPSLTSISDQTVNKNQPTSALAITPADIDSTIACSDMVGTSDNTTLIPNANIVIGGTAPNCTVTITPAVNEYGAAVITLTLTDQGTPMPALTATTTFNMTVIGVNSPPTISDVANQSTNEDTATSAIAYTINDYDSTITCANVSATSSNTTLVPNANLVIGGTYPNCTVTATPAADQNGTSTITLTVTDLGDPMPAETANDTFTLTVNAVNDVPTISSVSNQSTTEDTAISGIAFTISDSDSTVACSDVTGSSSDTAKVANASIVISGTAPNCTAAITPVANANGSATITLTLSDQGTPMPAQTASTNFSLTISSVPDLTGTLSMSGVASSYSGNTYARKMVFTGLTIDETISYVDVCLSIDSNSNSTLDVSEQCNVQTWLDITSVIGASGTSSGATWTNFQLKDGTNGASFTVGEKPLKNSCSTTNTYWLSVKVLNASNVESNVVNSSSWTFWEPSCLTSTSLAMWLDSTETATMTVSGGKLSNWTDKSGNSRTVTQGTGGNQPTYSATGIGTGYPGIVFNGTTTYLSRASFAYSLGSAQVLAVVKGTAAGTNTYLVSEGDTTANGYYGILGASTTNAVTAKIRKDSGFALNNPTSSSAMLDGTAKVVMSSDAGTSWTPYSNGTAGTTTAYTRGTTTLSNFAIGGLYSGGAMASYMNVTLGELFITNGVLSTTNRQKLESYSAHKWGTNASLDATNPYKTTPP